MTKRILFLAIILIAQAVAQQLNVNTLADFTGDAAKHAVSTTIVVARWVQFVAPAGNAAAVRVGDVNISSSTGISIAAGAGWMTPPVPPATGGSPQSTGYDLSKMYYLAGSGDKLNVAWGN